MYTRRYDEIIIYIPRNTKNIDDTILWEENVGPNVELENDKMVQALLAENLIRDANYPMHRFFWEEI